MAAPTAVSEAVPIISLRVNPTPFFRFEFIIAPGISLSFSFRLPRGSSQPQGQIHATLRQLWFQIPSVFITIELPAYLYGAKGLCNRRSGSALLRASPSDVQILTVRQWRTSSRITPELPSN
jgi:hypothetical protein